MDLSPSRVPAHRVAERREKNRLRSERWRRAHGIMPRKPAQKPWLAEGISRSTYYRRRKQSRERAALAARAARFVRAEAFAAQLQAELAEVARCHAVMAGIIGELAAKAAKPTGHMLEGHSAGFCAR
jgi:hypothetical protein